MKKTLLSILLTAAAMTAAADDATYNGSILYGHCTTAYQPLYFDQTVTAGEAMLVPASVLQQFIGCKITAVAIANGTAANGSTATELPINIFAANDSVNAERLLDFQATMPLSPSLAYTEYPLATPIEITTSTKPIYFGYTGVCNPAVGTPLIVDGRANSNGGEGDWFGMLKDGKWDWQQLRNYYGFGCIRVKIEGANLPGNEVSVLDSHIPDYVAPGAKGKVEMYLQNEAGNEINSVEISYTIGDATTQTAIINLTQPLLYNDYTLSPVSFEFTAPETATPNLLVSFTVSGVNGNATNQAVTSTCSGEGYAVCIPSEGSFKKNMVAEIATGDWCGFCPMGFVGVSKMLANHSDGTFIPICVHIGDAMAEQSYYSLPEEYTGEGSAPNMVINRNVGTYGVQNPSYEILSGIYPALTSTPAVARVSLGEAIFDASKKTLSVSASAEFSINIANADYGIAYVITEDNVGPYSQNNYFAQGQQAHSREMGVWNSLPASVDTTFNCVARMIRRFNGVKNSIPTEIEAGKAYEHTETLQTNSVTNMANCHVIALVVNRTTGRIENGVIAPISEVSAINDVQQASRPANSYIFDLQGRRVQNPGHGLYITNGKKIIL